MRPWVFFLWEKVGGLDEVIRGMEKIERGMEKVEPVLACKKSSVSISSIYSSPQPASPRLLRL